VRLDFDAWREADLRYYVSDTRKFSDATGWSPRVGVREGVRLLYEWLLATRAPVLTSPVPAALKSIGTGTTAP
jgi:CDP-paratose 2-epimerase